MKNPRSLLLVGLGLLAATPFARADQLDDMITALRVGAKFDSSNLGLNLITTIAPLSSSLSSAFDTAAANLYLNEIKLSIIDPANEGGWPYRSFLIEDDVNLRKMLTQGLTSRYATAPDPVLAYAMICPALYAADEKQVASLEGYLKANDPFLYKIEQSNVAQYWRPNIAATLKQQPAGN